MRWVATVLVAAHKILRHALTAKVICLAAILRAMVDFVLARFAITIAKSTLIRRVHIGAIFFLKRC